MLTHEQVWRGIDRLAIRNDLSPSGLAKKAGLDPTTFNKSKRKTKEDKLRWPSTESIAKILDATESTMTEFVRLIDGEGDSVDAISATARLLFSRLGDLEDDEQTDSAGFPVGPGWEEIDFPLIEDKSAYIIELDRDIAPQVYRTGDLVVISPASGVRRGDRVIIRQRDGEILIGALIRRTAHKVTIAAAHNAGQEESIDTKHIGWMSRIIWLSQ